MTMLLPEGVRADIRVYLVSAAREEVMIDVPGVRYLPPFGTSTDPLEFLRLVRWPGVGRIHVRGTWRFMTNAEIEDYHRRERDDGFNAWGCGPVPVERRDV
ncbi:hypothetical protein KXS07_23850 [Inquilinus limosus]|uniref:hypothetical protein n=1 Tax=Inquilinus limosus TaxID=171674 RepID=UPI003F186BA5